MNSPACKNWIFYGPPGTGKTYAAKKKAVEIVWDYIKESIEIDSNYKFFNPINFCEHTYNYVSNHYVTDNEKPLIKLVSMHDGMAPSDLLEGISIQTEKGVPVYSEIDKAVLDLIYDINLSGKPGILILDDIHRVNLVGVIGELLYGFAHKNEWITLSSGTQINVPKNLFVMMTMNSLMPQYSLDSSLLSSFIVEIMQNDEALLDRIIYEWSYKEFYFSDIGCCIDKIVNAKKVIVEKRELAHQCGNDFTDEFIKLYDYDYMSFLGADSLDSISQVTGKINYDMCEQFIWGTHINNPIINKEINKAAKEIVSATKDISNKYIDNKTLIEDLRKKAKLEWNRYNSFVISNLSDDFKHEKDKFTIGFCYFLPPIASSLLNSKDLLTYKVRGQIIPLIKQYIVEGILMDIEVPTYESTSTKYSFVDNGERIALDVKQKYIDVFNENIGNWDIVTNPINSSWPYNVSYSMVFSFIYDFIDAHLISDWQIMDILCREKTIINRMSNDDEHSFLACLLAEETVASTILSGDNSVRREESGKGQVKLKDGVPISSGNQTLKAYSPNLHVFKYRRKKYWLFSKIDFDPEDLQLSVDECREKGLKSGRRSIYPIVKVLTYELIRQYKENLENCLLENTSNSASPEIENCISLARDALRIIDEISWNGQDTNERRRNLYTAIISMPFWQRMINGNLKGVYMILDERYQAVMDATGIHQMILQGPPGTSKTYGAKKFLASEMGIVKDGDWDNAELEKRMLKSGTDENGNDIYCLPEIESNIYWDIIQFHPSYTYEDFVRGITVQTTKNGEHNLLSGIVKKDNQLIYDLEIEQTSSLNYRTVNKVLGKIAQLASDEEKNGRKFYLIIDEINRANLATVFGELIYALEYRGGKGVSTPYCINGNSNIKIPNNLYIIGTMNTADKSIASIDYAIRRRFLFFPVLPNIKTIYENVGKDSGALELKLFYLIQRYFSKYYNDADYDLADIQIGHTFFLREKDKKDISLEGVLSLEDYQMKLRFLYQVIPVMREYLNDGILRRESNRDSDNDDFSDVDSCIEIVNKMIYKNDPDSLSKTYDELIDEIQNNESVIVSKIEKLLGLTD